LKGKVKRMKSDKKDISRRDFVQGAVAGAALLANEEFSFATRRPDIPKV
jgi:hypothetical protein